MSELRQAAKVDLRVAKTQIALCTGLFLLLETTPFQKITVNDLCKTAMVSRATFYMHFEDKYHLLRFAMERMGEQIRCGEGRKTVIAKTVIFAHEKAAMLRNLLADSNQELGKMFQEAIVESVAQVLRAEEENCRAFDVPIPVLAAFIAGGISSILVGWIGGGFEFPPEEMATHLETLAGKWEQF